MSGGGVPEIVGIKKQNTEKLKSFSTSTPSTNVFSPSLAAARLHSCGSPMLRKAQLNAQKAKDIKTKTSDVFDLKIFYEDNLSVFSVILSPGLETSGILSFSQTLEVCGAQEMKAFSSTVSPSSTSLLEKEEKISGAWISFLLKGAMASSASSTMEVLDGDLRS